MGQLDTEDSGKKKGRVSRRCQDSEEATRAGSEQRQSHEAGSKLIEVS